MASPIESATVKTMAKHRNTLETALGIPVAFALESATGYRVERMLEAGLAFVATDKQVYLPFLGVAQQDDPWPTFTATKAQERALGLATGARNAEFDESEEPACVVQVLRYEPEPAPGCVVDPLSAILSLPDDVRDDPRVAGEIEYVLNRVLGVNYEGSSNHPLPFWKL